MASNQEIKVLEKCRVAPPLDAAAEFTLPLTFYDLQFLVSPPSRYVHFFRFRNDPAAINSNTSPEIIISTLKSSLSMALKHFLPLAGNLIIPIDVDHNDHLQTKLPELRYTKGDSVSLTIAESREDFDYLVGDHQKECYKFLSLLPQLSEPILTSSSQVSPLYALQITLFPNFGLSIGRAFPHVFGDATAYVNFNKLWASFYQLLHARSIGDSSSLEACCISTPNFYDRSVVQDPYHLGRKIFNHLKQVNSSYDIPIPPASRMFKDKVRSTFILHPCDITNLKRSFVATTTTTSNKKINVSTLCATCALVWTCLSKSLDVVREHEEEEKVEEDKIENVCAFINTRPRFEPPIPENYFGNCIVPCIVGLTHGELVGNEGLSVAATTIGGAIHNMAHDTEGILRGDWLSHTPTMAPGTLIIGGSTLHRVYDHNMDFSWGEHIKYECVSINPSAIVMLIALSRRFEGALELSLSLPKKRMDAFTAIFTNLIDSLRIRNPL